MRTILLAAFASLAVAPAWAQTATQWVEAEDDALNVEALALTVDQLEDSEIVDASDQPIGEVDDVLLTPEGEVGAVSVDLDDALGDRDVLIELGSLSLEGTTLRTSLTREEIEALPAYDD